MLHLSDFVMGSVTTNSATATNWVSQTPSSVTVWSLCVSLYDLRGVH